MIFLSRTTKNPRNEFEMALAELITKIESVIFMLKTLNILKIMLLMNTPLRVTSTDEDTLII